MRDAKMRHREVKFWQLLVSTDAKVRHAWRSALRAKRGASLAKLVTVVHPTGGSFVALWRCGTLLGFCYCCCWPGESQ